MPLSSLPAPVPPPRAPVVLSSLRKSATRAVTARPPVVSSAPVTPVVPALMSMPTAAAAVPTTTSTAVSTPLPTPIRAGMVFRRDGIKVSRVVMTAGSELPVHSVDDDVVIVVIRGVGIVFAQQEPRHVESGSIVDLVPGEEHSVECIEDLEFVLCQVTLASRIVTAPPVHPAG